MNFIKNLIQKAKIIWDNRKGITSGIINYLYPNEHVEQLAEKRMSICNDCILIDLKGDRCLAKGTQPCCAECGCSLEFKTRSVGDSCPMGKW